MHLERESPRSKTRHSRGLTTYTASRFRSPATRQTPTTLFRTPSSAPSVHGIHISQGAIVAVGCSRSVVTSSSDRVNDRARPWELESSEVDAIAIESYFADSAQDQSDDMFARLDLQPAIHRALARIPEPFRSTLVIVDVEDRSYESAAEALGVPIGTVRSRLFRGRRLMQEYLLDYAADAGLRPHPVARRVESHLSAA